MILNVCEFDKRARARASVVCSVRCALCSSSNVYCVSGVCCVCVCEEGGEKAKEIDRKSD